MDKLKNYFKKDKPIELDHEEITKKALQLLNRKTYKFLFEINTGTYGSVVAVQKKKRKLAAKIVLNEMTSDDEKSLWSTFNHRNLLPLLKIIKRPRFEIFLMSLLPKSMYSFMQEEDFLLDPESFEWTKKWLKDVLNGLHHLHGMFVAHLDLKADNVLISFDNTAVICDFSCTSPAIQPVKR